MTDGSVCGLWFVVVVCGLVYLRKIRPTQLWVKLSWVVAILAIFTQNAHRRHICHVHPGYLYGDGRRGTPSRLHVGSVSSKAS